MKYYMENRQKFDCNAIIETIFENYGNDDFEGSNFEARIQYFTLDATTDRLESQGQL
jgi:hypothetical protein